MTLYGIKLNEQDLHNNFIINKDIQDFGDYTKNFLSDIEEVDDSFGTEFYTFSK